MLSPRRSAQLGVLSAVVVLVASMTILIRGGAQMRAEGGAPVVVKARNAGQPQMVLGAHSATLGH